MSIRGNAEVPPFSEGRGSGARSEWLGLALLACALGFNAFFLAPELWIGRAPLNDGVFHLAASERLAESFGRGEPFLDPWVSEWALGYPVWRSYQPLPHLFAAAVLRLASSFASHGAAFAALLYVFILLLPASAYVGARLLGLRPAAAGLASLLVLAPNGMGELGRYGLGYGATTWRGSGLYTQVVALHFLLLAIGSTARALDTGRRRGIAALAIVCAALSHIVFGYVAFVSAALLAMVGAKGERSRRLVRLATIALPALLLLAWFVVPLFLSRSEINHSRWEPAFKWDSFGAPLILRELFSGRLLDAGRLPILSLLLAAGTIAGLFAIRETLSRRLLALSALWLVLFFGRETWGHLLLLAGVPADLPLHRLQAAFELSAVLLAAWGLERTTRAAASINRWVALAVVAGVAAATIAIGVDGARYLQQNASWGEENLVAFVRERAELEASFADVHRILAERPGRVSAGKAASWGKDFKVGSAPVYSVLTREHFDQVSFLYHSMSLPSDVMVLRDEADPAHDAAFGVRAIVAPSNQRMPPHLRLRSVHGRFAVYEGSPEGYFGLVDIGARYTGGLANAFEPNAAWLKSPLTRDGVVVALDASIPGVPALGRWEPMPPPSPSLLSARGRVISEAKTGETYGARVLLLRPCYALVKMTYDPHLVVTVDGAPVPTIRVTPGFLAVPVPVGEHEVQVRYAPGPLKPLLLLAGVVLFGLSAWGLRRPGATAAELAATNRFENLGSRLATPRAMTAFALAALVILSMRPLFRGRLIDGHDALAYPPRLTEMGRALADGLPLSIWAADLSSGHGQPLFEFVPPLATAAALPFHLAGFRLADSLQIGLALLFACSAAAVYRIGRRIPVSRFAALAGSAAWLFAPYVALDLYVRAAFSEATALAVAPVALLALLRALDRPSPSRVAIGGAASALILLAHNPAALLMIPVLAFLVLLFGRFAQSPSRSIAAGGATLLAGLGLSCYFWLPAMMEKGFVKLDQAREGHFHWSIHAISPLQLLWSRWGYGVSVAGRGDEMSFALGPLHLLLAVAGVVFALRSSSSRRAETAAFALAAAAGAWLATEWSALVWSNVETLQFLQFPWRALMLPALFLSLLAVYAFERLGPRAGSAVLGLLIVANLPHTEPKGFLIFDDEYYSPRSIAEKGINTTTQEEFEPHWVEARPPFAAQKLKGSGAPIEVRELSATTRKQEFTVRAQADGEVEASTFSYPGWTITVDGKGVPVWRAPIRGTMLFHLPRGEHRVVLELLPTFLRHVSRVVTAATLATLALAFAATLLGRSRSRLGIAWDRVTPYGRAALWVLVPFSVMSVGIARGRFVEPNVSPVYQGTQSLESEETLMKVGLDALYARNDPNAAAEQFRKVLERNPGHYGATYQLARALDSSGKRAEARPLWEKMLQMAETSNDQETLATVRARLQERP